VPPVRSLLSIGYPSRVIVGQSSLAGKHGRKPSVRAEAHPVLPNRILADLDAFAPQSRRLLASSTGSSLHASTPQPMVGAPRTRTDLGLMPPWALITRCQGTLSWWNRALLAADGRFLRQTPTCLEGGQAIRGCCSNRHGAVEGGCTWHTGLRCARSVSPSTSSCWAEGAYASPPAGQCARSW